MQTVLLSRVEGLGRTQALKFQQVYTVVDSEYRLLWVGGEWDEFALQNAAQRALANDVLSTSLLAHIAGEETRQLISRLIEAVLKTRRPLRVNYRCDSPSLARDYLLTIQPMRDARVLMVHDLKDAWHFSPPLNLWHYDPTARDCKCSFCGNVRFDGRQDWISCDYIGDRHPAYVVYVVCGDCHVVVADALERVLADEEIAAVMDDSRVDDSGRQTSDQSE